MLVNLNPRLISQSIQLSKISNHTHQRQAKQLRGSHRVALTHHHIEFTLPRLLMLALVCLRASHNPENTINGTPALLLSTKALADLGIPFENPKWQAFIAEKFSSILPATTQFGAMISETTGRFPSPEKTSPSER